MLFEKGDYGDLVKKYLGILEEIKCIEAVPLLSHFLQKRYYRYVSGRYTKVRIAETLGNIGSPDCIMPLIKALNNEFEVKKSAGSALVRLYQQTELPETLKQEILSHRYEITTPHDDYFDGESCEHHDKGIGVDFPL